MAIAAVAAAVVMVPLAAIGHPLGNFTINQYLAIHIEPEFIEIDYVVDRAEIPASQELGGSGFSNRDNPTDQELASFAVAQCGSVAESVIVDVDATAVALTVVRSVASAPDGAGGLSTLRVECLLRGDVAIDQPGRLTVRNKNFSDRLGWTEIVVTAADVVVTTDLGQQSVTDRLRTYPLDRLQFPPDMRQATVDVRSEPGASQGVRFVPDAATQEIAELGEDRFSSLLDEAEGGAGALVAALAIAFVLGAGHAAAPGHGKTVMAASLIGTRGRVRHAMILGLSIAISHTAGVLVLGSITFAASAAFAPEAVFPYLAALSGLIVTAIGVWIVFAWGTTNTTRSRSDRVHAHDHDHDQRDDSRPVVPDEPHSHGFGSHTHGVVGDREITWKLLATLGLSGGLVPSVSAILLLLAAINIGRMGVGLVLILMFGIGMATTLVGVGIGAVFIGERALTRIGRSRGPARFWRFLAPAAGVLVTVIGAALTVRALMDIL